MPRRYHLRPDSASLPGEIVACRIAFRKTGTSFEHLGTFGRTAALGNLRDLRKIIHAAKGLRLNPTPFA